MSDDSDDEPLGVKPSGVGTPTVPGRFSSRPTTAASAKSTARAGGGGDVLGGSGAAAPRPKFNGDVLGGGGGDGEGGSAEPGSTASIGAYDGGLNAGRNQSAALSRARDIQLRKRTERLATMGMAVSTHDGPAPSLAPLQRPTSASCARSAGPAEPSLVPVNAPLGSSLASQPTVTPRSRPAMSSAPPPAYDDGAVTPRGTVESAVQPVSTSGGGGSGADASAETARAKRLVRTSSAHAEESAEVRQAPEEAQEGAPEVQPAAAARPVAARPAGTSTARARAELDLSDLPAFLSRPAPEGPLVQCHIVRAKAGFMSSYPKYTMLLKQPGKPDLILLAARKRGQSKSSNYLISLDADDLVRESGSYFGKLRSNFLGTEFVLYDNGCSPDKDRGKGAEAGASTQQLRTELCAVLYKQNVLYTRGPRRMTVLVPALRKDGQRIVLRPSKSNDESSILEKHKSNERDADLVVLKNKSPKWNDVANAYVLNFNGRVTQPSVKNFQIVDEKDSEEVVIMQFGRVGDNDFTCDFQAPLSPLQAFGIALSSFDYKIACE